MPSENNSNSKSSDVLAETAPLPRFDGRRFTPRREDLLNQFSEKISSLDSQNSLRGSFRILSIIFSAHQGPFVYSCSFGRALRHKQLDALDSFLQKNGEQPLCPEDFTAINSNEYASLQCADTNAEYLFEFLHKKGMWFTAEQLLENTTWKTKRAPQHRETFLKCLANDKKIDALLRPQYWAGKARDLGRIIPALPEKYQPRARNILLLAVAAQLPAACTPGS